MKDITLGQFFPGDTLIHRLDARVKLVMVIFFIVELFLVKTLCGFALMGGLLALAVVVTGTWLMVVMEPEVSLMDALFEITSAFGTVETVSLSSTVNNGVASYPITISADNTEGNLQVNSYVNYQIQASQNDNCLMVPIQAVRTVGLEDGSSATVVYVQADSRPDNALELPYQDEEIPSGFYPVQVEIGIQDTYNVEIKSGVNDGDTVFTQMITDQAWG